MPERLTTAAFDRLGRAKADGVSQSLPTYRLSKFQPLMPPWVEREVVASYLLDVGGAWKWLSGSDAVLERVPRSVRVFTPADAESLVRLSAADAELATHHRDETRPLIRVQTQDELDAAVVALAAEPEVGLDVETTLSSQVLCLIQIAAPSATCIIDPLAVESLSPLERVLGPGGRLKIIHYADFECEVLGRLGFTVEPVCDTRDESRRLRGPEVEGGPTLKSGLCT